MTRGANVPNGVVRVLMLSTRPPDPHGIGGVDVHIGDLVTRASSATRLLAAHVRAGTLIVEDPRRFARRVARFDAADLERAVQSALAVTHATLLHVHSPELGSLALSRAIRASGVRAVCTLHDVAACDPASAPLLDACDAIIAPSRFLRERAVLHHPEIRGRVRELRWGAPATSIPPARVGSAPRGGRGVLHPDKGADRLPELMRACASLPVEWHLFGATLGRSLARVRRAAPSVVVHGAYRRQELGAELARAEIDAALLASTVAEAFCMTLSECAAAGVPVVASDRGALGERVREERVGWLFEPDRPGSLRTVLESLLDRGELGRVREDLLAREVRTPDQMTADHELLYRELGGGDPRALPLDPGSGWAGAALEGAWRALRRTKFYRDLPLRRALPEALRGRLEERTLALLDRLAR